MGLSERTITSHIGTWEQKFARSFRKQWPGHIFRHEPLENAVNILKGGVLLSRNDAFGQITNDIAPISIINARGAAHSSARLYFRPQSPTQYRIEGIKKQHEYIEGKHAPVLILFVFNARKILTIEGVRFSNGNMQTGRSTVFSTDRDFLNLPFDDIYHYGPFDPSSQRGDEIKKRRCAEVLTSSPLPLQGNLEAILCRSSAERTFLIHALGPDAPLWQNKIVVPRSPGYFVNRWSYVETVELTDEGVIFSLHPRQDGDPVLVRLTARDQANNVLLEYGPGNLSASNKWIIRGNLRPGLYFVSIEVEGCQAFASQMIIDDLPF